MPQVFGHRGRRRDEIRVLYRAESFLGRGGFAGSRRAAQEEIQTFSFSLTAVSDR